MSKIIKKALLGVVFILIMIVSLIFIIKQNNNISTGDGVITFIVNTKDGIKEKKRINYNKEDTLFEILNNNYVLEYENTAYGHFLLGIKSESFIVSTDGRSSWLWFELAYLEDNKEYSDNINFEDYKIINVSSGIDGIELKNNMIFAINERDSINNVSIFDSNINIENNDIFDIFSFVFKIIIYVILAIFIIGIVLYYIFSKKNNDITIRELAILAFMTVLLFIQEELLTFIPNFQLTFLLIAVYTNVFGIKRTSLIVLAHVLLDNILMGSVLPYIMIPMLIGYYIYMGLIYLFRNRSIIFIVLIGIISSLIYCYLFLITNVILLNVDILTYFIMDIPFEVMLASCSAFTLFYLYKPLSNKLNNLFKEKDYTNTFDV